MPNQAPPIDATQFPILDRMDFFNHAGVGPISGPAAEALRTYTTQAETQAYVDTGWYRRAVEVKALAAQLINARGGHEIAFIPNTSTGLSMVAKGLALQSGEQVVISNVEYPANRYPWQDLVAQGVELVEVQQSDAARIEVADVLAAITEKTKVVSLSHVQYASGHRIDLTPIAEKVHAVGGYLCVDGIQSCGVLPVDVQAMGIDFLSADGHKWLLSPEGCGIFYCNEALADRLHPNVVGWMNMVDASNYGDYRFEFQPDARRFEPGSWNIPGIVALGASIDLLLSIGIDEVWGRVKSLTDRLCVGLADKGYRVFTPREHDHECSGIVIFDAPAGTDPKKIAGQLQQQHQTIIVVREGRLRVSPHFYNTPEQIDRLLAALP